MPDFAAIKELVEQHVDSYRCSRASLVQALTIRRPLLELQALLVSKPRPWTHGSLAILLESTFHVSAIALSLSIVKHGSFLFAYFLEQMKKTKNNLKNCACLHGAVC